MLWTRSAPENPTSVIHVMNVTFIHTIAADVDHMGGINVFAVVHRALRHCCISPRGTQVQTKSVELKLL